MDLIRCVQHGGIDLDGDTGHTGSRLDLRAVGVPVQVLRAGVLAVQACLKGIGAAQRGVSLAGDADRRRAKDGSDIQVLLEVGIRAGLAGDTIAPLDKDMALSRDSRHGNGLARVIHLIAHRVVAGAVPGGQGAAAALFHLVAGFKLRLGGSALAAGGACGLTGGFTDGLALADCLRAGSRHRGAGIGDILQRAGGDVIGIRTAVLGLISMGAQVSQRRFQACTLEVDVTVGVVIRVPIAVLALECLSRVEELEAQLLAHVQQCHVEVVDLGLIHVGVGRMILRDGRHGVDNDVRIRISRLNGLHQRGVVADEILHLHAGIVGAKGHHHAAGLHLSHGLCNGIVVVIALKGHDALVQGHLRADALPGAELLQGDEAVVVEADRIGIAQEEGAVLILAACISRFGQQGAGRVVDLIMACQIPVRLGRVYRLRLRGRRLIGRGRFSPLEERRGNSCCQQGRQHTDHADQNRLLLHRGHRAFFRLCISTHVLSPFRFQTYSAMCRIWSARFAQSLARMTGWNGSSSSRLP